MHSPKISVIVPVFNRENTISTCIEGVLNNDYKYYEIIIVDDGSSDKTLEICQQLAEKHPIIRVYTQPNAGVSAARNTGIEMATGDWLLFVDSDDTLCPNAISHIAAYLDTRPDLLMYLLTYTQATKLHNITTPSLNVEAITRIDGNQKIVNWLYATYNPTRGDYHSPVTKAFKTAIIQENNIRFRRDVSLGEDQIFVCDYLKHVLSLAYINQVYTHVLNWPRHLRSSGLGSKLRSPEDFLHNQIENYKALNSLYNHTGMEIVKNYASGYILDRPVTRILFNHLCIWNKSSASISEIIAFTAEKIKPVIELERAGISRQKNRHVRRILQFIISGHVRTAVWYAFIFTNMVSTYRALKSRLRAK